MNTVQLSSGRHFEAGDEEALVDAAMRQGIVLPYSCRTGRCSTCKCQVLSGDSVALRDELGLTESERASGWILSCVRAARTDMRLALEDLGDVRIPPARTLPCRIQALDLVSDDVLRVELRLPPNSGFAYLAGQYIDVIGQGGVRRAYSIANAPGRTPTIELHIRRVDGGQMSRYWFGDARQNDLLRLHGPLGTFFLPDVAGIDVVGLATGTGLAPIKAMLECMDAMPAEQRPRSVAVYWGGRTPQDLYWRPDASAAPCRFVPVLSRADPVWSGRRGWITEAFMADNPDLTRTRVFACGSEAMIKMARTQLIAAGLPTTHFHSDAFVASSAI